MSKGTSKQTHGDQPTGKIIDLAKRSADIMPEDFSRGPPRVARRLTVELPDKGVTHLDWIQAETGAMSAADVIRDALKLYYGLLMETHKGTQITLTDSDGTKTELRIFL
jgi:hypothetical protein